MKIDITQLTEDELIDLNRRITERLRFLSRHGRTIRCWNSRSATG